MEILITHINYAGMNAREMIYKSLSSKSIEPWHNGLSCYMQKCALSWIFITQTPQRRQKSPWRRPSFVSISPHLRPWWDFYLEAWGRDLNRIWTGPAITTTQQPHNHQSPQVYTQDSTTVMSHSLFSHVFCPSPATLPTMLCCECTISDRSTADIQPFITPGIVPLWLQSRVLALSLMSSEIFVIYLFTKCQMHQISHSGCTAIPIHFQQKIDGCLQCNPDETG